MPRPSRPAQCRRLGTPRRLPPSYGLSLSSSSRHPVSRRSYCPGKPTRNCRSRPVGAGMRMPRNRASGSTRPVGHCRSPRFLENDADYERNVLGGELADVSYENTETCTRNQLTTSKVNETRLAGSPQTGDRGAGTAFRRGTVQFLARRQAVSQERSPPLARARRHARRLVPDESSHRSMNVLTGTPCSQTRGGRRLASS
jgi:hypothetical protein